MACDLPTLESEVPDRAGPRGFMPAVAAVFLAVTAFALSSAHAPTPEGDTLRIRSSLASPHASPASRIDPNSGEDLNKDAGWVSGPLSAAAPFLFKGSANAREYAVSCLAAAAWYEAGDDARGQRSVIQVVLNRLSHPNYPKTICGVVFEGSSLPTGCQFTFTCDGSLARRFPGPAEWSAARVRAQAALDGKVDPEVSDATNYHADYVDPWWSSKLEPLTKIGHHIFYRWPTGRQLLRALPAGGSPSDEQIVAQFSGDNALHMPQKRASAEMPAITIDLPAIDDAALVSAEPARAPASFARRPGTFVTGVDDPAGPSGRWAVDALTRCAGFKGCSVASYESQAAAERNLTVLPGQRDRPLFLFVRDPASGMNLALWDCTRVKRPDMSQCLPTAAAAVSRIMRINND